MAKQQVRNRMTFAGRPFRLCSEPGREHIDRYYPLEHLQDVERAREPVKNLQPLGWPIPPQLSPRLNDFYYPMHASRWSCFRGLMTGEDMKAALEACFPSNSIGATS